jgi:hypothetical protein
VSLVVRVSDDCQLTAFLELAIRITYDDKCIRIGVGAVNKFVFIKTLDCVALSLIFVDFALHMYRVFEKLLGNCALAGEWVLQHSTEETFLVKSAFLDILQVEILFPNVMKRLDLKLWNVVHPR